eukprot:1323216-Rhodomonas_salina.1
MSVVQRHPVDGTDIPMPVVQTHPCQWYDVRDSGTRIPMSVVQLYNRFCDCAPGSSIAAVSTGQSHRLRRTRSTIADISTGYRIAHAQYRKRCKRRAWATTRYENRTWATRSSSSACCAVCSTEGAYSAAHCAVLSRVWRCAMRSTEIAYVIPAWSGLPRTLPPHPKTLLSYAIGHLSTTSAPHVAE